MKENSEIKDLKTEVIKLLKSEQASLAEIESDILTNIKNDGDILCLSILTKRRESCKQFIVDIEAILSTLENGAA